MAANPSSDVLTAVFDPVDDTSSLPGSLRLTHEKMGIVKEVNVQENYSKEANKTGLKVNIDIHELPKDTYYLQAVYGNGKIQSTRVVIQ